ncbi:adenosylmethionine decarboxylase [bacterium]|nr:adenosylmethionine decarboxylase [bacterium]
MERTLGTQLIVELYECNHSILDNLNQIEATMLAAAKAANATIINHYFHKFSPCGVSGVIVIAESHIAIHTWPEHGYCAIDIFTCGNLIDNDSALDVLKKGFQCKQQKIFRINRGLGNRLKDSIPAVEPSLPFKHN